MQAERLRKCVCVLALLYVCVTYLEQSTVLRHVPVLRCSALRTHTGPRPQLTHGQPPMMLWQNS